MWLAYELRRCKLWFTCPSEDVWRKNKVFDFFLYLWRCHGFSECLLWDSKHELFPSQIYRKSLRVKKIKNVFSARQLHVYPLTPVYICATHMRPTWFWGQKFALKVALILRWTGFEMNVSIHTYCKYFLRNIFILDISILDICLDTSFLDTSVLDICFSHRSVLDICLLDISNWDISGNIHLYYIHKKVYLFGYEVIF